MKKFLENKTLLLAICAIGFLLISGGLMFANSYKWACGAAYVSNLFTWLLIPTDKE